MKKQGSALLLALTLVFASFSLGFFSGRNFAGSSVQVSTLSTTSPIATEESTPPDSPVSEPTSHEGLINVNTADQQTLMLLPGVGEVLSQRIIDYRNKNGPFSSLRDLLNVSGIGEQKLEAIIPLATVGG